MRETSAPGLAVISSMSPGSLLHQLTTTSDTNNMLVMQERLVQTNVPSSTKLWSLFLIHTIKYEYLLIGKYPFAFSTTTDCRNRISASFLQPKWHIYEAIAICSYVLKGTFQFFISRRDRSCSWLLFASFCISFWLEEKV